MKHITKEIKIALAEVITNYLWEGTAAIEAALNLVGLDPSLATTKDLFMKADQIAARITDDGNIVRPEELADEFIEYYS